MIQIIMKMGLEIIEFENSLDLLLTSLARKLRAALTVAYLGSVSKALSSKREWFSNSDTYLILVNTHMNNDKFH